MAELVDAHDSKSCGVIHGSSILPPGTAMKREKILILVGPTASGKSALGVALARKLNGEIISADSRQVYKGLDIGTGKITKKEMRGIPHHLLDIASPKKTVTAQDFKKRAAKKITEIAKRGHLPLIVGGTGFYIDALTHRIALPEIPPNKRFRTALQKKTAAQLFSMLKKKDPARAHLMDTPSERNNKVRLIRALEIASSNTQSRPRTPPGMEHACDALWIGIRPDEKVLEQKIQQRLRARLQTGMIQEARRLRKNGLSLKRMESLGLEYRSLARFLKGIISKEELEAELFRGIRRYAKKQRAYWKRNADITWFKPTDTAKIQKRVASWLKR